MGTGPSTFTSQFQIKLYLFNPRNGWISLIHGKQDLSTAFLNCNVKRSNLAFEPR